MSRFLFAAAFVLSAAPAVAEARFFTAIDDLPLAPGLIETGAGFVFDGAEGRIVETAATGAAAADAVRGFYTESLPALGWSFSPSDDGALVFLRGREQLTLRVSGGATRALRLEARLITRPASMRLD